MVAITQTQLENAALDADAMGHLVNDGAIPGTYTTRTGRVGQTLSAIEQQALTAIATIASTSSLNSAVIFSSAYASLSLADSAATSTGYALVIDNSITLSANITLSAKAVFILSKITLGNYNLTFSNSSVSAAAVQIFVCNGTGRVIGTIISDICVDWWGTTSTSIADPATSNAGNYCSAYVAQSANPRATILLHKPSYYLSGAITWSAVGSTNAPSIIGNSSQIFYSHTGAGAFVFGGTTGAATNARISGFVFTGTSSTWGLEFKDCCKVTIDNVYFSNNAFGIVLNNTNDATEYVQWRNCDFDTYCIQAWWHKRSVGGGDSQHGCGAAGNVTINNAPGNTASPFLTDAGMNIYNAPSNWHIWLQSTLKLFSIGSATTMRLYGNPTIEIFSGVITGADTSGPLVLLDGDVNIWGAGYSSGNLRSVFGGSTITGGYSGFERPAYYRGGPISSGVFSKRINWSGRGCGYLCHIQITGPSSYAWAGIVATCRDASGVPMTNKATLVSTILAENLGSVGVPTSFGFDGVNITINNAGYVSPTDWTLDMGVSCIQSQ